MEALEMTARVAIKKADVGRVIGGIKELGLPIHAIEFDSERRLIVHTQPVTIRGNSWDDDRAPSSKRFKV